MNGHNGQPPEKLEDQLRRMILANPPTGSVNTTPGAQPSLALPHHHVQNVPQQAYPGATAHSHPNEVWPTGVQSFAPGHPHLQYNARAYNPAPGWQPSMYPSPVDQNNVQQRGHFMAFSGPSQPQINHAYHSVPSPRSFSPQQRARHQEQFQLDPNAFQRHTAPSENMGRHPRQRQSFNLNQREPSGYGSVPFKTQVQRRSHYLEVIANDEIRNFEMSVEERASKEKFRETLQTLLDQVRARDPDRFPEVSLQCFGSFQSGFATQGSDMDLVIVVKDGSSTPECFSLLENDLPRALEKQLLLQGHGARLLTRTRVPIIKVCEKPDPSLLDKLRAERERWDFLPNEKKYPHLYPEQDELEYVDGTTPAVDDVKKSPKSSAVRADPGVGEVAEAEVVVGAAAPISAQAGTAVNSAIPQETRAKVTRPQDKQLRNRTWTRERKAGPLDFPTDGVGILSDINFFNPLGLHNTNMLACYSLCDQRVRPMVLLVKAWAKRRKINSSYSGTLSSYGYVLMVLHYLMNIANPPVLPNLQSGWRPPGQQTSANFDVTIDGWQVSFWAQQDEIKLAAGRGQLTANTETLGSLLAGFFLYFSSQGPGQQFKWMQEVLSLRLPRGVLSKEDKGWTKAVIEESEGRRVQNRYLFCIEDPFELNHNVARTVTHNGVVAIREEFRRARRILLAIGYGQSPGEGDLCDQLVEQDMANEGMKAPPKDRAGPSETNQDATSSNPSRESKSGQYQKQVATSNMPCPGGISNKHQLDVRNTESFPALGASVAKSSHKKKVAYDQSEGKTKTAGSANEGEISGQRARVYLEKLSRKNEAHAEQTTKSE